MVFHTGHLDRGARLAVLSSPELVRAARPSGVDLRVQVGTLLLKNPIIAASGTFGYGVEFAQLVDLNRLGALVVKGLSIEPRAGNPSPRMCETSGGMLNSIGLRKSYKSSGSLTCR
jgi:hypothetical protein